MANLFQTEEDEPTGRFAQVALEQGLETPEGLTYRVPESMEDLRPGDRVTVPLGKGNRPVSGYVLSVGDAPTIEADRIKAVAARDRDAVRLDPELIELARWISHYYCCPLGMVFASMLPASVKHGTGLVRRFRVALAEGVDPSEEPSTVAHAHGLRGKQAAVLHAAVEMHRANQMPMEARALADRAGARSLSPVRQLIQKGLLQEDVQREVRAGGEATQPVVEAPVSLNADQERALEEILPSVGGGFHVHVLHGVTGSGKTEVYIRAIERVVHRGGSAIVLVPEIALTPQTVQRFVGRFDRVAVLHSGLTAAQRHEQWLSIREGWARVVVGARSALFAPAKDLGLIVVDEEHDSSYKQDQLPRYHARDLAIKRAQLRDIPTILGSATPSLESFHNARQRDRFRLLSLPRRVAERSMPHVRIVDLLTEQRRRRLERGERGQHLLSIPLETALQETFAAGGQAILLLNRRGYASSIACPDYRCGWMMTCDHCDVMMVYHLDRRLPTGGYLRCHYCGFENLLPSHCPACGRKVNVFGLGTQRVDQEVERKFPEIGRSRLDSDTMRTGQDYERTLDAFGRGEVQLLLGTQMIAKGLDFENVRLVGVISADTALNLPDFRAGERTFQLVAQVAGRSGRGTEGGQVVVQTFTPEHPVIRQAADHDYFTFAEQELDSRAQLGLPPVTRMARIVARDAAPERAYADAKALTDVLQQINERLGGAASVVGPSPPAIARISGYHRQQIELFAPRAGILQKLLQTARAQGALKADAKTAVDVDPVSLI